MRTTGNHVRRASVTGLLSTLLLLGALDTASAGWKKRMPKKPQPISAFEVRFEPTGKQRHPATDVDEVKRLKTVAHWPREPDWVSDVELPSGPYVPVGRLHFPFAWHWLEAEVSSCPAHVGLIVHHVRKVGGHAVLLCEVSERARGVVTNPDTGSYATVSYREITLDVIRYTDGDG